MKLTSKKEFHKAMLAAVIALCSRDETRQPKDDDFMRDLSDVVEKHFEQTRYGRVNLFAALETVNEAIRRDETAGEFIVSLGVMDNMKDYVNFDIKAIMKILGL